MLSCPTKFYNHESLLKKKCSVTSPHSSLLYPCTATLHYVYQELLLTQVENQNELVVWRQWRGICTMKDYRKGLSSSHNQPICAYFFCVMGTVIHFALQVHITKDNWRRKVGVRGRHLGIQASHCIRTGFVSFKELHGNIPKILIYFHVLFKMTR